MLSSLAPVPVGLRALIGKTFFVNCIKFHDDHRKYRKISISDSKVWLFAESKCLFDISSAVMTRILILLSSNDKTVLLLFILTALEP